jgi:hypothetical protein
VEVRDDTWLLTSGELAACGTPPPPPPPPPIPPPPLRLPELLLRAQYWAPPSGPPVRGGLECRSRPMSGVGLPLPPPCRCCSLASMSVADCIIRELSGAAEEGREPDTERLTAAEGAAEEGAEEGAEEAPPASGGVH